MDWPAIRELIAYVFGNALGMAATAAFVGGVWELVTGLHHRSTPWPSRSASSGCSVVAQSRTGGCRGQEGVRRPCGGAGESGVLR